MSHGRYFVFVLLALVTCCSKAAKEAPVSPSPAAPAAGGQPPSVQRTEPITISVSTRKLIKTADVEIEVANYDAAFNRIAAMAKEAGGFLSSSSVTVSYEGKKSGSLSVRLPSERYDGFMEKLRQMETVVSIREGSQDITEEYFDLDARLSNARKLEQRYLELLKSETGKLSDILEVERELSRVREDIERMEGRRRYLDNMSDLATVNITLYEPQASVPAKRSLLGPLKKAVRSCVEAFISSVATLLVVLVAVLPWLIIIAAIVYAYLRIKRKRRPQYEVTIAPAPSPPVATAAPPPPPPEEESRPG